MKTEKLIIQLYAYAKPFIASSKLKGRVLPEEIVHDIFLENADKTELTEQQYKTLIRKRINKLVEEERNTRGIIAISEAKKQASKEWYQTNIQDPEYRKKRNKTNREQNKQRRLTNPEWVDKTNATKRQDYANYRARQLDPGSIKCGLPQNKCYRLSVKKHCNQKNQCPLPHLFNLKNGICHHK